MKQAYRSACMACLSIAVLLVSAAGRAQDLPQASQLTSNLQQLSALVQPRSDNVEVEDSARRLNGNAIAFNEQLRRLAQASGSSLGVGGSAGMQSQVAQLDLLRGMEFDRAYLANAVVVLRQLLGLQLETARRGDAAARALAIASVLELQQQLLQAEELQGLIDADIFLLTQFDSGQLQMQAAQLALNQGVSAPAAALARSLIASFSTGNEQLAALARGRALALPGTLTPASQGLLDTLGATHAADTERAWLDLVIFLLARDLHHVNLHARRGGDAQVNSDAVQLRNRLQALSAQALNLTPSVPASASYRAAQSLSTQAQMHALLLFAGAGGDARPLLEQDLALLTSNGASAAAQQQLLPLIPSPALSGPLIALTGSDAGQRQQSLPALLALNSAAARGPG